MRVTALALAVASTGCAIQTQQDMCVRSRSCVCVMWRGEEPCECQPMQKWECTFRDLEGLRAPEETR